LRNRLGSKTLPSSVFKLVTEDEGSAVKLKSLIEEALKNSKEAGSLDMTQNNISGASNDKIPRIEVLLSKNKINMKAASPIVNKKSPSEVRSSNLDETRTNIDKSASV